MSERPIIRRHDRLFSYQGRTWRVQPGSPRPTETGDGYTIVSWDDGPSVLVDGGWVRMSEVRDFLAECAKNDWPLEESVDRQ